ncbi:MAG: YggT family protein [Bifidobacteriaceae bacterium]|jgi:YggT family protein|nr:YggT family protein [Bifidobacteriaceae bacterium]
MRLATSILALVAQLYLLLLLARLVLELVLSLARAWRPSRPVMVLVELVYTSTDPPLRLARRFIRPVRVGRVSLDLAFLVVMLAMSFIAGTLAKLAG